MSILGIDLVLVVASVVVSALCSGLEIAFVSSNKLYIELERKRGAIWARLVSVMLKRPGRVIGALLVGNNIALVLYGILMAQLLEPWLRGFALGHVFVLVAQTSISTLIILIFAEFLPKVLFRIDPSRSLGFFAIPLQVLYIVLWLPMMVMTGMSEVILRLFGIPSKPGQVAFGRIDLNDFLKDVGNGQTNATTMDAEVEYFRNTLELSNTKVRELMVPRAEIEAMEVDDPVEDLRQRFIDSGMSKLLIHKDNLDNILGYVHGYELFRNPRTIRAVMRPVNFIPGTMPADEALQMFIKQRTHVAVVVDEFGGTAGILTMEDVVETIVGDIEDEHDTLEEVEERLGPNEFLFSARMEVAHLIEAHRLNLPESEEYDTLAGYIMHTTGTIPDQGQVLELAPFRFTIAQVVHGRMDLVRMEVTDPELGFLE
ncbi:MAG: HlyC/CorC family transporter [Flavobacteriales bacterium]|nr:HlyC/CorC family transporter [Flavobacteriales bacterium]MBK6550610.1 HlyC/CorC family transporter [Flavobacteriales bacterium]MBK6884837.1 HlyC/CorC family transporter [Flavobacteriales bacterium]MBK7102162.1 HlyC/CorC family transporter [Flavobacteriales bacterium]MBK7112628.1 HlyC/CorC family transporter [Flavobacteriales bacterium]